MREVVLYMNNAHEGYPNILESSIAQTSLTSLYPGIGNIPHEVVNADLDNNHLSKIEDNDQCIDGRLDRK